LTWNWFDLAFPWIGGGGAVVLLVLLFGTNVLRSDPTRSRWRDPAWLSWLAAVAYLLHNVEEYGVDLVGAAHAFPDALCTNLKLPAYPGCPIPPAFYLAVNIPLFWVLAPLVALLSRRRPLVGLALYSVIFINGLTHVALVAKTGTLYNPGLLTAVLIFLPLSVWVGRTCFGPGRLSYPAMALLIAWGVLLHVILAGSVIMFINGLMGGTTLASVQVVNAALLLLVSWIGGEYLHADGLKRTRIAE